MILPDWMISELCNGHIPFDIRDRFGLSDSKIKPMVDPFDPSLVNPASLDIRVGSKGLLRKKGCYIEIDLDGCTKDKPYWLEPQDRILIDSLETFNLPNFICAQFRLKSSRGREWYEHTEAGFCDPGWHGSKLTMELINMDIEPLPLYKGLKMGQLIFCLMFALPEKSYAVTGRYNNDKQVMRSKG